MRKWLINDALSRVWSKPNADHEMVCRLTPLNTKVSHRIVVPVEGRFLELPDRTNVYQVYDLGNFHPKGELNINYHEGWVLLDVLINRTGGRFFFYDLNGVVIPTQLIYVKRLLSDRFVVAIQRATKVTSETELYCKLYDHAVKDDPTNSYFGVTVESWLPSTAYEIYNAVTAYKAAKVKNRFTVFRCNGIELVNPEEANINIGDYIEIYSDDTIIHRYTFDIGELTTFVSTLDDCKKYLIHTPKTEELAYRDDLEFTIQMGSKNRYFPRHFRSSLTQLTHADYAIACNQINDYATIFDSWNEPKLVMVIRDTTQSKALTYNSNRVHELYRLSDDNIINVMTGLNSHLDFWKAANLEISPTNYLRSNPLSKITHKLVSDSYGYNAASYYVGDTPQLVDMDLSGVKILTLPPLYQTDSTIYEYDEDGALLGWWYHLEGTYTCRNNNTHYVEAVSGGGGSKLDIDYDVVDAAIDTNYSYRYYLEKIDSEGVGTGDYKDVTDDSDTVWVDDNSILRWKYDTTRYRPLKLGDTLHLVKKEIISDSEGVIRTSLTYNEGEVEGILLPFKFATVEVFMNAKPLVYGIDFMLDWPAITITNKTHLLPGGSQEVIVRARVPAEELNPPKTGFIINGVLSDNTEYDIKDDKVLRLVVGGQLKHRDDITFREDTTVVVDSTVNGQPYSVDSVALPLQNLLQGGYGNRRLEAIKRDKLVEDFMTVQFPTPYLRDEQPLSYRYPLYSPTFNKMIVDYEAGDLHLVEDDSTQKISTGQLDELVSHYEYLFESDPAYLGTDDWFVTVEPHWGSGTIEVDPLLFTFLDRVNTRYFSGRVKLSFYLIIKES